MKTQKIIAMDVWRRAGAFERAARPGDRVTREVVDSFISAPPLVTLTESLVQCGPPRSYKFDDENGRWRETFTTFYRTEDGWQYRGHCFAGKDTEPQEH